MAGFDSPNFKKTVQTNQKPLREFTVGPPPDESNNTTTRSYGSSHNEYQQELTQTDIENLAREARRQKLVEAENSNRVSEVAKKRIEILADIGRLTKDVSIGKFLFSLRTLKSKETKEAALATFSTSVTQLEASYEARKQQIARAIFKIDGEDIDVVFGSTNLDERIRCIDDNFEDIVVEKLWNEFILLKEEAKTKYGINSVKEAEEVSEDLKK